MDGFKEQGAIQLDLWHHVDEWQQHSCLLHHRIFNSIGPHYSQGDFVLHVAGGHKSGDKYFRILKWLKCAYQASGCALRGGSYNYDYDPSDQSVLSPLEAIVLQ